MSEPDRPRPRTDDLASLPPAEDSAASGNGSSPDQGEPSVAGVGPFSEGDWDAESFALFAEGANPRPCPHCERTGFYGPRFAEPDLKYRACRFCGLWQEVGGAPGRYVPTSHDCEEWPVISKAPYLWWVAPETRSYVCPFCELLVAVSLAKVPVPSDTPDHPWWKIPQHRRQSFYQRLWQNWECSAGRTVL